MPNDSLDGLTPNDVEVIEHVWHTYGKMSKDELIHEVHHALKEWTVHWEAPDRRQGSVPVSYAGMYGVLLGLDDEDAADAADEVAYFRSVNEPSERSALG